MNLTAPAPSAASASWNTIDVAIVDRTQLGPIPTGSKRASFTATVLPTGTTYSRSFDVTTSAGTTHQSVEATVGDFSFSLGSSKKIGPFRTSGDGDNFPAKVNSQIGAQLMGIADSIVGSDLLHPYFKAPKGEAKSGSANTVTFGYWDDVARVRHEATFAQSKIPAALQQAFESARDVMQSSANFDKDMSPFQGPKSA